MVILKKYGFLCTLLVIGCLFSLSSCRDEKRGVVSDDVQLRSLPLQYATHFHVEEAPFGYVATIYAGEEDSNVSFRYALVRDDSYRLPEDARKINIPIDRMGTNSGTLFEFLRLLGVLNKVVATCDVNYLYSDDVREKVRRGDIVPLGSSFDINAEKVLVAHPDVLFLSDLRDDPHTDACPVVHNFEWKEPSALARAEWIKFISLFFDKYAVADSIFQTIEQRYMDLKKLTDTVRVRPTVFAAGMYGDTWYLTGGKGFMSKLYEDAGGTYLLSDTLVPTVTCGTEWLLAQYAEADFWMNCGMVRKVDLDPRLRQMKSYKNDNVYHFQKREKLLDGIHITDFYESAVAQPDVLLSDLISIFHPELLPNCPTVYIGRCESEGDRR